MILGYRKLSDIWLCKIGYRPPLRTLRAMGSPGAASGLSRFQVLRRLSTSRGKALPALIQFVYPSRPSPHVDSFSAIIVMRTPRKDRQNGHFRRKFL